MRIFFIFLIFFSFTHQMTYGWGGGRISDKQYLPDINVQGVLNQIPVIYLSINGLVKHVPFYRIPENHNLDPRGNVVYFDLVSEEDVPSISKIELASIFDKQGNDDHTEIVNEYDGMGYVHVLITFTTGVTMHFLLDAATKIRCYEKNLNKEALVNNRTLTGEWQLNIKDLRSLVINKVEFSPGQKLVR